MSIEQGAASAFIRLDSLMKSELRSRQRRRIRTIGPILESASKLEASLDAESRLLGALRDTLLPQLMSGTLRVRDAEQAGRGGGLECAVKLGSSATEIHVGDVSAGTSLLRGPELLDSVSPHISQGHRRAVRAANPQLLLTYSIGREILTAAAGGWGAKVIDRLSADVKSHFLDARGYSPRNLKYMRAFAGKQYLLDKLNDQWTRELRDRDGWSRDILAGHIDLGTASAMAGGHQLRLVVPARH